MVSAITAHSTLSNCRKGSLAEALFAAECLARGIGIATIAGNAEPFDVITFCDKVLRRVQIKGVYSQNKWGGYQANVRSQTQYKLGDFDFYGVIVPEARAVYIIPQPDIVSEVIIVYPNGHITTNMSRRRNEYERYRDRFDYLTSD